ncbi:MAG: hypothetical protein EOR22_23600 [Mesorhizobium sp.]|nr:MAG: hypothetical protein EOR22_23600 [Mesorhizobium sp.]
MQKVRHIDPELVAKAKWFLSYAADARAADLVIAERFNIDRSLALEIVRKVMEAAHARRTS